MLSYSIKLNYISHHVSLFFQKRAFLSALMPSPPNDVIIYKYSCHIWAGVASRTEHEAKTAVPLMTTRVCL